MRPNFSHFILLLLCSIFSLAAIAQPLEVSLDDYVLCAGDAVSLAPTVTGGQPDYTYQWSPAAGLSCADCATPLASIAATTTFYLTVTDAAGSSVVDSSVVTVAPNVTTTLPLVTICPGDIFDFNDEIFTVSGTYQVVLTSALGCDSTVQFDLLVEEEMVISFNLFTPPCVGGSDGGIVSTTFGGTAPLTYAWSNGATTPDIINLGAGSYCLTVTSALGCIAVSCTEIPASPPLTVQVETTDASCQNQADGAISAVNVTGGVPPYAYAWSTGPNTSILTNLLPGTYQLTITDANGCTALVTAEVGSGVRAVAGPDQVLHCDTGLATLSAAGSTGGPNLTYQWTGPNGFSSQLLNPQVSEPGMYTLLVTDPDVGPDCMGQDEVLVLDALSGVLIDSMVVELIACGVYRLSALTPPTYFGPIDWVWTLPDGSTQDGNSIVADETGLYLLTSSIPGAGCVVHTVQYLDVDGLPCATLRGRVATDVNLDCLVDAAEAGIANAVIAASGPAGQFYALTDANGHYELSLPLGNYELVLQLPTTSWMACAATATANLATPGATTIIDFAAQAQAICPELAVRLSTNFLRRCFHSRYYVQVCNEGTAIAEGAMATLVLDDLLTYQSAQLTPTTINGQTLSWELPNLLPGQCQTFWVEVLVSCQAILGQVHCSELSVTPDSLCMPTAGNWSGASLEVQGECAGPEVRFRVRNAGVGDLTEPVNYIVIEDAVMLMEDGNVLDDLASQGEVEFVFPANGSTYVFQIEQASDHPFGFSPAVAIEGCGLNDQGGFSTGWVEQYSLPTSTPASDVLCVNNIGAYDPNDKLALPVGAGEAHFVKPGVELSYRLRFQNTGTDTAFTVVIRDTLSDWLDFATLQPGPASHPYRLEVQGQRTLVFTFDDILLPDSTTNLDASQGFVDFRVRTRADAPLGERVYNSAAIYFDFNEPVITNTVFHTFGEDFLEVINTTPTPEGSTLQLRLWPNPAADAAWLWLEVTDYPAPRFAGQLRLINALGQTAWQQTCTAGLTALDLRGLAPGLYWMHLHNNAGRNLGLGRLVVQ